MDLQQLKEEIADAKDQFNDQLINQDELEFQIGLAQDFYHRSNHYKGAECHTQK